MLGLTAWLVLGSAVTGTVVGIPFYLVWRRLRRTLAECETLRLEAETAVEIVAAVPDGFLLRDSFTGETRCSRRLAVLLELPDGTDSGYEDVLARFDAESARILRLHCERLYAGGQGFALRLPIAGDDDRRVQIVGIRAERSDNVAAADILWFHDLSDSPQTSPEAATALPDLRALLEALPFPVWLRGAETPPFYTNLAGQQDSDETFEVTELCLDDGQTTVGFAIPPAPKAGEETGPSTNWFRILETAPTAMAVWDGDARLLFANNAFAALWQLDPDYLATAPRLADFLDRLREARRLPEVPDYAAFRAEQMKEIRDLEGPVESLMHLPDGRTLRRVAAPNPGGGLLLAYEDLSERLSLERTLNELNAVQRETLDNLFEGVAVFGADGRLRLSNPALTQLWNLDIGNEEAGETGDGDDADAPGMHVAAFAEKIAAFLPDDGIDGDRNRITASALMSRQSGTGRVRRIDGRILEFGTIPLPDGALMVSFMDVTDRARVEQALRQRAEALDAANRLKSEFIANVSHEIRTPLTTLIGFAEILTDGYFGKLNHRQEEYAQGILDSGQALMSVVNDILDLASIEAGMMALELDIVEVHALLAGLLKLIRERARHKGLIIDFDCPSNIGWIVADERRLKQVFFNLLSNAVHFTPRGGRIGLSAYRDGDHVVFAIADSGPGMKTESLDQLRKPFRHGPTPESAELGSGLGLSLVTRFVELHNGTVEIRSARGHGTTIKCRLPTGDSSQDPIDLLEGAPVDPVSSGGGDTKDVESPDSKG